jgi:hypothetical protein
MDYLVRSLGLATRAFQDFPLSRAEKPSHDWHVQPVVKDQIRIPPKRRVSVEPQRIALSVLETLSTFTVC